MWWVAWMACDLAGAQSADLTPADRVVVSQCAAGPESCQVVIGRDEARRRAEAAGLPMPTEPRVTLATSYGGLLWTVEAPMAAVPYAAWLGPSDTIRSATVDARTGAVVISPHRQQVIACGGKPSLRRLWRGHVQLFGHLVRDELDRWSIPYDR
jgi:hypothetical protein